MVPVDTRWHQRFDNFRRALLQLQQAVELSEERPLSDLERQGLIQAFEFTHELSWKTLKDFLTAAESLSSTDPRTQREKRSRKG